MRDEATQAKTEKRTGNVVDGNALRGADFGIGQRGDGNRRIPGGEAVSTVHAGVGSADTVFHSGDDPPK